MQDGEQDCREDGQINITRVKVVNTRKFPRVEFSAIIPLVKLKLRLFMKTARLRWTLKGRQELHREF
jgi:hypothetical protein